MQVVDHDHAEVGLALQAARAGADRADREAGGVVDVERHLLHQADRGGQLVEVVLGHLAGTHLVAGDLRLVRQDTGGELFGRHFHREERGDRARPLGIGELGVGGVVRDRGGERGLAHARASGEDDQVGVVETAEEIVEVGEAGGHAREAARLMGGVGHLQRCLQRARKVGEAARGLAGCGKPVEAFFRLADLVVGGGFEVFVEGVVDHVLAERDQLAADEEIVDQVAVLLGVDDADHRGREPGEVARAADAFEFLAAVHHPLQGDRVGGIAALGEDDAELEDLAVGRIREVLRLEEVDDLVDRRVVVENRAQQRLFGLDVVRRRTGRDAWAAAHDVQRFGKSGFGVLVHPRTIS